MFVTKYTGREIIPTESGEKTRPNYKPKFDSRGNYVLEQDGVFNSYDDIQSHAESTDLALIMQRYNMTGDSSLLNVRQGFYEDITGFPANYAEMQNMLIDANNKFMELPLAVREEFGQDPAQFYMAIGTDRFAEIMAKFDTPVVTPVDVPVVVEKPLPLEGDTPKA